MAKRTVTAADMAARLMGQQQHAADVAAPASAEAEAVEPSPVEKGREAQVVRETSGPAASGTKRLNLNITVPQWRKLKTCAMDRGTTASDLVREFIDGL